MKYFVGVEGFSMRHSVAVLSDEEGTILGACRETLPLNLHTVKSDELANRLKGLLQNLFHHAGLSAPVALPQSTMCIGMAGVTYAYDRYVVLPNLIDQHLEWRTGNLICTGDAEIAFLSHAQQCRGSLIIAHTGSVAYAVNDVDGELHHYRYGGWGPQIGDEGSGYWIGKEVMREICLQHAERQVDSPLWLDVLNWLNDPLPSTQAWSDGACEWRFLVEQYQQDSRQYAPRPDLRTMLYRFAHSIAVTLKDDECRFMIAGLVIPLMTAYRRGDESAIGIMRRAMTELAEQYAWVRKIAKKVHLGPDDPIVLYGGVLDHNEAARTLLMERLSRALDYPINPKTKRTPGTMRPALGALLFALSGSKTGALRAPNAEQIRHVAEQQALPRWREALEND